MKPRLKAVPKRAMAGHEPLLEIGNLGKVFHVRPAFLTVLEGLDFKVKRGEMICVLGRSGCGKTTLLKILAGFMQPSTGTVRLNGRVVSRPGPDRCFVFQEDTLFPWLTVRENIAFGLKGLIKDKKSREKEVGRFLSLVGLKEFGDYMPHEVSGGMRQRVALARVLILKPQVLLMDEPFASLDAQTREEMQNLLLSLWERLAHTIIFVTHDVNEAITLADRILVMGKNPGHIREEVRVNLARPRKMDNAEFINISRKLFSILRD